MLLIKPYNDMKDLFNHYQEQPPQLKAICDKWSDKINNGLNYKDCANFQKEVEAIGYTFDYELSAEPFNLRKADFYFLFVISDSIEHQYKSYKKAVKKAKKLNEKVYLCIYSFNNIYAEVYDEEIINHEGEIEKAKESLINSFRSLTTAGL